MKATELAILMGNIDEKYIEEAASHKPLRIRKVLLVAAVICMLTALSGVAFAADWFGIRSLIMTAPAEEQELPDTITLAGYVDTAEFQAATAWHEFLASYDVMEAAGSGNGVFAPGTSYNFYQVYNQEMADKLDEIVTEYNLKLHSEMITDIFSDETLCGMAGGDFLGESNHSAGTYMYEDGTFKFDGVSYIGGSEIWFQFMRSVKGSFNEVSLNIGDGSQYEEWAFEIDEGVSVALAMGPNRSLVIADFEDCMVTVIVLAGSESGIDRAVMEQFAESFDFSVLSPVKPRS